MSFDAVSYIMGKSAGAGVVVIDGDIVCTDDGDGNITIEEVETSGE